MEFTPEKHNREIIFSRDDDDEILSKNRNHSNDRTRARKLVASSLGNIAGTGQLLDLDRPIFCTQYVFNICTFDSRQTGINGDVLNMIDKNFDGILCQKFEKDKLIAGNSTLDVQEDNSCEPSSKLIGKKEKFKKSKMKLKAIIIAIITLLVLCISFALVYDIYKYDCNDTSNLIKATACPIVKKIINDLLIPVFTTWPFWIALFSVLTSGFLLFACVTCLHKIKSKK